MVLVEDRNPVWVKGRLQRVYTTNAEPLLGHDPQRIRDACRLDALHKARREQDFAQRSHERRLGLCGLHALSDPFTDRIRNPLTNAVAQFHFFFPLA